MDAADPAGPRELEPLTAEEQINLIRRSLDEGLVLDRFAGSVPIFHRATTAPPPDALRAGPTVREWLDHAAHGVQSLSDLFHEGGADGKGITVKEFRAGCDFIWEQIEAARAALAAPQPEDQVALDVELLARALYGIDADRIARRVREGEMGWLAADIAAEYVRLAAERQP